MTSIKFLLMSYLGALGWALVGAISMALGLAVALKIFTVLTPGIDEVEELKKGNLGVAIVLAAVIMSMGIVVAVTVLPESFLVGNAP
jgi:uncharacterized membrane protein YjfL (UPF0719 family)